MVPAMKHYRLLLLQFFDPKTGGTLKAGTFRLYPAHCKPPTISEDDRIVMAAADLITALDGREPESVKQWRQHVKNLQQLTTILNKPIGRRQQTRVHWEPSTIHISRLQPPQDPT